MYSFVDVAKLERNGEDMAILTHLYVSRSLHANICARIRKKINATGTVIKLDNLKLIHLDTLISVWLT